jgi:hypothetical protein
VATLRVATADNKGETVEPSLTQFLVRLVREPELLDAFRADSTGTMNEVGLAAEDQEILLSGDADRINGAIDPDQVDGEDIRADNFM